MDISIVNAAETFWSVFNLLVPKKRFRQQKTLADAAELTRHYLNLLRPHEKLGRKTPIEAVGFNFPSFVKKSPAHVGVWADLLRFAETYHKFVEVKRQKILRKIMVGDVA